MSEQQKKDLRGFLHPNKNKTKATQPDYTGTCLVDGKEFRIAAWENKAASDGTTYLSLTFSLPLTPEQQNEFNKNKEKKEENSNQQGGDSNAGNKPIYDESEDISQILRFTENDNPFE